MFSSDKESKNEDVLDLSTARYRLLGQNACATPAIESCGQSHAAISRTEHDIDSRRTHLPIRH